MKLKHYNRNKTRENNADGENWCPNCDRALVSEGEECPACGVRCGTVKREKPRRIQKLDFELEGEMS